MSLYSAGVEYGIHCLLFLVGDGGESREASVRDLAELQGVPQDYLAKIFTKNSLKTIGEHFGGRDHTTVIHSCQTVKDLMDTDNLFRESVIELQQKVQLAAM